MIPSRHLLIVGIVVLLAGCSGMVPADFGGNGSQSVDCSQIQSGGDTELAALQPPTKGNWSKVNTTRFGSSYEGNLTVLSGFDQLLVVNYTGPYGRPYQVSVTKWPSPATAEAAGGNAIVFGARAIVGRYIIDIKTGKRDITGFLESKERRQRVQDFLATAPCVEPSQVTGPSINIKSTNLSLNNSSTNVSLNVTTESVDLTPEASATIQDVSYDLQRSDYTTKLNVTVTGTFNNTGVEVRTADSAGLLSSLTNEELADGKGTVSVMLIGKYAEPGTRLSVKVVAKPYPMVEESDTNPVVATFTEEIVVHESKVEVV